MRLSIVLSIFVFVLISGCTEKNTSDVVVSHNKSSITLTEEKTWNMMGGKWFGSQPTADGGIKQHIVERWPDGTYKIAFRNYDNTGRYRESVETGLWGISGPVYFTIFRGWIVDAELKPTDSGDPYNYDAYKILRLTDEDFEYESYSSGSKYLINKVADDFEFPKH